jgi:hypothetical protein
MEVDVTQDGAKRARIPRGLALLPLALLLGIAAAAVGQEKRGTIPKPGSRELWLFFSPAQSRLAPEIRALGEFLGRHPEIVVRPAFFVENAELLKKPSQDLADTLRALGALPGPGLSLRLWDDEGLARARALGVYRFPAWALIDEGDSRGRRARVAIGYAPKLEELLK